MENNAKFPIPLSGGKISIILFIILLSNFSVYSQVETYTRYNEKRGEYMTLEINRDTEVFIYRAYYDNDIDAPMLILQNDKRESFHGYMELYGFYYQSDNRIRLFSAQGDFYIRRSDLGGRK